MPELQSSRESSDDESIDLANLSPRQFLELAKEKPAEIQYDSYWGQFSEFAKEKPAENKYESYWEIALYVTFLFAPVAVDPLFLYIPIINEDMKCLMLDQKLKKTALILRSLTDLPYIAGLVLWILFTVDYVKPQSASQSVSRLKRINRKISYAEIIGTTLGVLPIPQMVILIFCPTIRGPRSLNEMKFLNSVILLQYVARALPIYYLCTEFNKRQLDSKDKRWIPGVLNFTMYILASHVLGAFWYFFSIQRQLDCWIYACRSENACEVTTFHCDKSTSTNITLLNDLCPTNPPNAKVFDFGIFLDALQSGLVGSTDFPKKLLQCFSWGLRNLSSFASNLNTSNYVWETLFVISISISGLILFLYLLGHLQTFMQATRRTHKIRQKVKTIDPQIEFMVSEYGLRCKDSRISDAISSVIIRKRLQEEEDLVVENIFSLFPPRLKRHIKRHLFLATLKKVPGLEHIDKKVLNSILEHLEPVNYAGGSFIIREGEPLARVIFIAQGSVLTYNTCTGHGGGGSSSSSILRLEKGAVYGEELITWAATSAPFSDLPISPKTVQSHEKVEVFTLMASDLQHIVSKFSSFFNPELPRPMDTLVQITDGNL